MIILFIRHAEAKNDKITKLGRKQLAVLSRAKEDYVFSKIYTSPTTRCYETAKSFNKKLKLPVEIDFRLNEREQLSKPPGTKDENLWYENYMNKLFSNSSPEGCKEYLERIFSFLGERIFQHYRNNENIVIVSHTATVYAIMAYLNKNKNDNINWYKIGNCSKLYFEIK